MKRGLGLIIALVLLLTGAAIAEEAFEEEAFFAEESFGEELFFEEEDFFDEADFAGEEAFEETFAEEATEEDALPEEEADAGAAALEDRSIVTLNMDDTASGEPWAVAPQLVAIPQAKDGSVKLQWAQPGLAKLEKGVSYYVYAVNQETGVAWQVGKPVKAAKKPVTVTVDGVAYTGVGGSVTLKKQADGTEYFVRAEEVEKEKLGKSEEYGLSSNTVTYENANAWKVVRILSAEATKATRTVVRFESVNKLIDEQSGFQVVRTRWEGKAKTTEPVPLGEEGICEEDPSEENAYILHDEVPEGTTKVTYSITTLLNGVAGKTAKTKALSLEKTAWKKVYGLEAQQVDQEPELWIKWTTDKGLADKYTLTGFADSAVIAWDAEKKAFMPVLKKGKTSITKIEYELAWRAEGVYYCVDTTVRYEDGEWIAEHNNTVGSDLSKGFAELFNVERMENVSFKVYGRIKENDTAKLSVTPSLKDKKGQKSSITVPIYYCWSNKPELTGWQTYEKSVALDFYITNPFAGEQILIKGFKGGDVVLEIVEREIIEGEDEAPFDVRVVKEPNQAEMYTELTSEDGHSAWIYAEGNVSKNGKLKFTVQPQKKVGKKTVKGKKATTKVLVQAPAKASTIAASLFGYGDPMGGNNIELYFSDINPNSKSFRVSIADQPAYEVKGQPPFRAHVEFDKPKDEELDENGRWSKEISGWDWGSVSIEYEAFDVSEDYKLTFKLNYGKVSKYYSAIVEAILEDESRIIVPAENVVYHKESDGNYEESDDY